MDRSRPIGRATKEEYVLSQTNDAVYNEAAPDAESMKASQPSANNSLLEDIKSSLDDDKAEDMVVVSLSGKSEMADYMVICSGRSSRQVAAMSEKLTDHLKQVHGIICKVEGKEQGDWVLIDAGDVIVHVFRPEVREFYQLEKMWLTPAEAAGRA